DRGNIGALLSRPIQRIGRGIEAVRGSTAGVRGRGTSGYPPGGRVAAATSRHRFGRGRVDRGRENRGRQRRAKRIADDEAEEPDDKTRGEEPHGRRRRTRSVM